MNTAFLITTEGRSIVTRPANGKKFTLQELQQAVGGYIEIIGTKSGRLMVLNECGKRDLPRNQVATFFAVLPVPGDYIAGQVLVADKEQIE